MIAQPTKINSPERDAGRSKADIRIDCNDFTAAIKMTG